MALAEITPVLVAEQRDKLLQEITVRDKLRSPATVNRYLAALSHVFTIAIKEWGWIESNPISAITKPKEPRGRVRFLSDKERENLLAAAKDSDNHALYLIIVLCLSTGARKMEILGLKWTNVDLERGIITLHETKNGERRVLPLTGHALSLMHEHAKIRRIDSDLVFPSSYNPHQPIDIRTPFETALEVSRYARYRF